jgi:hypothetical protein
LAGVRGKFRAGEAERIIDMLKRDNLWFEKKGRKAA